MVIEKNELRTTNWKYTHKGKLKHVHTYTPTHSRCRGIINSNSAHLKTKINERFIFSHVDCKICNGDESHNQWCLFH